MKNNTQLIYQNGTSEPLAHVQNEDFKINWQYDSIGKYFGVFDYEIIDKSKISVLGFNSCLGGSIFKSGSDEIKITLDVSDEVNGIVLITEKNGIREDNLLQAFYFGSTISITDYYQEEYTAQEKSEIFHALSVLNRSNSPKVNALADLIGGRLNDR